VLIGQMSVPDEAYGVGHQDSLVYIGCETGGLVVANASDPAQPYEVGRVSVPGLSRGLEVRAPYLYAATTDEYQFKSTVRVFDISNPVAPVQVDTFFWEHSVLNNLAVHDSVLYACSELYGAPFASLQLLDISDPTDIQPLGTYLHPERPGIYDVVFGDDDTLAIVSVGTSGMAILNVSDPMNVVPVCTLSTAGYQTVGIGVFQDHAFLLKGNSWVGMVLVDISDPANPAITGNFSMGDMYGQPAIQGQTACLCRRESGVELYDIADILHPAFVGVCSTRAYAATARGELLYVSRLETEYEAIEVYSISDPAHPVLLCDFDTMFVSTNMVLRGDYLYCVGHPRWVGGTHVVAVDVTDSTDLRIAGRCRYYQGSSNALALDQTRPYLYSSEYLKLRVFDISNPDSMAEVTHCELPGDGSDIRVQGRYAYVACYTEGFVIVDIHDPLHPNIVGQYRDPSHNEFVGVEIARNAAVLANRRYGLYLLDVSDPRNIVLEQVLDTPGLVTQLCVSGDSLMAASDFAATRFISIEGLGMAEGVKRQVCDSRGPTLVSRSLSLPGSHDAVLVDITGRKVMGLQPGPNDIRHLAPGVYFIGEGPRIEPSDGTCEDAEQGSEGSSVSKVVIQK
jgi:hypothetical protein